MRKAIAAIDAIVIVSMVAISALTLTKLPDMINDVRTVLEGNVASEQAKTLEDLESLASASPDEIKIKYSPKSSDELKSTIEFNRGGTNEPTKVTIQCASGKDPYAPLIGTGLDPCRSQSEVNNATQCEKYNPDLTEGYHQWNWVNGDCFFVPGPNAPEYCRNGVLDTSLGETAVDCGGLRCAPCGAVR